MWTPRRNAALIHLLILVLLHCLLVYLASLLLFSLLIFPYLSTSLLTFSLDNVLSISRLEVIREDQTWTYVASVYFKL